MLISWAAEAVFEVTTFILMLSKTWNLRGQERLLLLDTLIRDGKPLEGRNTKR